MRTPVELTDGRLSQDQIETYWEDGYLFPIPVIPAEEAQGLRAELEEMERRWLDNGLPLPLNTYKRINAHCVMPMAHRIAADPRVLDVVEGIIGPDILIWSVEFFIKEPRTKQMVSMHQDLTYWGFGAVDHLVTAWIALSPATPDSGCMNFVRGSHKNPILPHVDTHDANNLLSRGQEIRVDVAEEDREAIEIHPGQMSLHHGLTIHGSDANITDDRRIACVVRYLSPQVAQQVADKDYAILARGADRTGHFINFTPPDAPFTARSLALYDEIRKAQAQALMKGSAQDKEGLYA
ncbi:phytanoyl-CoA dioxygenase family protein [Roseovarius faecimaris]|uniref:Phytanoyl-CoA dioxygenase family protein n=1 Tax=Roseovarius faecimaris TaxID=2494550 RepID=A0A6I6INL7_9RHOB|nr:phytanoyl-CoA dioxygenase family protein [Roseovarius faecimaris]QGX97684.1 phytanoyl-CoA dioxygenase family protein [Roseovarius faecimaris]